MRRVLLIVCLFVGVAAGATDVYRWVDSEGVVHFSDRPKEGAELVQLQEAQTFSAPQARPRTSSAAAGSPDAADAPSYQTLEIVKPGQEEVLWNLGGQLDVTMRLEPRLQIGHRLSLYLDDQPVEIRRGSLQTRVTDVGRGVHVLLAEVRDQSGTVLLKSQPRTFVVQQTSIQNPNNPANAPVPAPLGPR